MNGHFDLLTLKLFIAVLEEKSIAKASEREHIAISAISKRISDLEDMLGVTLLMRHHKGVEATPSGQSLLFHARQVMQNLADIRADMLDHSEGVRGRIRIVANVTALVQFLPNDIASFVATHPKVRINLNESISPTIVRAVLENEADIGIMGGNIPSAGLQIFPYREDRLIVIVPNGHPLAQRRSVRFADVLPFECIGLEEGSSIDSLCTHAAADLGRSMNIKIRVAGMDAIRSMVVAGLGIGIVPALIADDFIQAGKMVGIVLDEPWTRRPLNIAVRDLTALPVASRLLVEHLQA